MTRLALLWHMHQPYYEDLMTGEHILPWVRLHALKDYYGMVALLREFPRMRVTFNLVPSLLVQLEAFAADRARDAYLDLGLKPAAELVPDEAAFIVRNFFHAERARMIDVHPRYAELMGRRGRFETPETLAAAVRRFTTDDLRDLQVWQKLVWIDPLYVESDARVRNLLAKGRGFNEDDKQRLREVELEILNAVIPEYRAAAERGQIEISASPFYHPILPLLCDSEVYTRTHPDSPMPRRFVHPEDAAVQLARARACHERLFGRAPAGVWPSEGSVSDAIVPLLQQAGFRWMATDEQILARSLGETFTRGSDGRLEHPERLYAPYTVEAGGARITCLFRDHVLSDLIGFTYSGWQAEAAAEDFVRRVADAGRGAGRTGGGTGGEAGGKAGGEDAVVSVILDGENAWEYFEGGGRPFLRALYRRLSESAEVQPVTMSEAAARPGPALKTIFPGSWIDANFYVWIGHADDRRAWNQLGAARQALDSAAAQTPGRPPTIAADALEQARDELYIAEGSDWFWWYGDDRSSDHDLEFDDLFRRHVRNAYRFIGQDPPQELFVSNISTAGVGTRVLQPTGRLAPTIDGRVSSYFEWLEAGSIEVSRAEGAMHRTDVSGGKDAAGLIDRIWFGADKGRLYLRLDTSRPAREALEAGFEIRLQYLTPAGLILRVHSIQSVQPGATGKEDSEGVGAASQIVANWAGAGTGTGRADAGLAGAEVEAGVEVEVAADRVLELAIAGEALESLKGATQASLFITVRDATGAEIEHHPPHAPLDVQLSATSPLQAWSA